MHEWIRRHDGWQDGDAAFLPNYVWYLFVYKLPYVNSINNDNVNIQSTTSTVLWLQNQQVNYLPISSLRSTVEQQVTSKDVEQPGACVDAKGVPGDRQVPSAARLSQIRWESSRVAGSPRLLESWWKFVTRFNPWKKFLATPLRMALWASLSYWRNRLTDINKSLTRHQQKTLSCVWSRL